MQLTNVTDRLSEPLRDPEPLTSCWVTSLFKHNFLTITALYTWDELKPDQLRLFTPRREPKILLRVETLWQYSSSPPALLALRLNNSQLKIEPERELDTALPEKKKGGDPRLQLGLLFRTGLHVFPKAGASSWHDFTREETAFPISSSSICVQIN